MVTAVRNPRDRRRQRQGERLGADLWQQRETARKTEANARKKAEREEGRSKRALETHAAASSLASSPESPPSRSSPPSHSRPSTLCVAHSAAGNASQAGRSEPLDALSLAQRQVSDAPHRRTPTERTGPRACAHNAS